MSKPTKHHKPTSKVSSASSREGRQSAAKQMQASKKRSKAQARISRGQAADVTAQINGEFAQVQSLLGNAEQRPQQTQKPAKLPESTVQDLADVMNLSGL
ncbi:uncharacterized protein TRAVEDRAFT_26338 [Trametes versicolor FP-101664 SS1]|uniref:uncharacterized protein n=1 Tax=Trametes versicolor (strain FP-101664) TaxID=717944 RepID=UPI0004623C5E|nr:uncharacterized protein TRAVEDRAFT_26338 [Trametes versicolor FP-101664 SS1]EIW62721.1 hypothetical protein TRAVEDRAFT_26338 [Trametes versicolor FP-101664 SS1]